MMGAFVTGADYIQAQRQRRALIAEVDAVLGRCDVILCAGTTSAAPLIPEVDEGPFRKQHPMTSAFNATGHPALSMPCGFGAQGMPLSLSIVGPSFGEAEVLRAAQAYEAATDWMARWPSLEA